MYRCTECYKEYEECPDFCDCGNDTFQEIVEEVNYEPEEDYYEEPAPRPRPKKKRRPLTEDEMEELREMQADKQKAMIALAISIVISVVVLILPPHMPKKMDKVKKAATESNVKLPGVNSYWDNTPASPQRKADASANLPVLNKYMSSLSPDLKDYLKTVGNFISRKWDSDMVNGSGECYAEFTIDKEGNFISRGIIKTSENETMNDSVHLLLDKVTSFDLPPDDYKGERIIISFKKDANGTRKVSYPTVK